MALRDRRLDPEPLRPSTQPEVVVSDVGRRQAGKDSPEGKGWEQVVSATETRLREALAQIERLRGESPTGGKSRGKKAPEHQSERPENRLQEAEVGLRKARQELEEQRIQTVELTTVLGATEYRVSMLEREIGIRDRQLAELQDAQSAERARYETELASLAAELETLRGQLSTFERSSDTQSRTTQPAAKADGAAVPVPLPEGTVSVALDQLWETLKRERAEWQALVEASVAEGEELRKRLAEIVRLHEERAGTFDHLQSQVAGLELGLTSGRERELALQWKVTELQEAIQKGDSSEGSGPSKQTALREELERSLAAAHAREAQARSEAERLSTRFAEVRDQCKAQELENERLKHRNLVLQRQHAEEMQALEQRLREVEKQIQELGRERDRLREQVAELVQAKERLERERDRLRRRADFERERADVRRLHAKVSDAERAARPGALPVFSNHRQGEGLAEELVSRMPDAPAVGIPFDELPIVAIGASTGGPASLGEILSLLPADLRACLLIVQHMPPGYTADLAYCLDQRAAIHVVEGRDGDELKAGVAFIAPGGQHMQVKNRRIHLSTAARVNMQRPSVDVLFESLVPFAGRVHAILLSGMGQDGVAGMSRLHQAGAVTIVQDEATSIVWGMPGAAVKAGCVSAQLPPTGMARHLLAKVQQSSSPAKPHDTAAPSATHETRVNG